MSAPDFVVAGSPVWLGPLAQTLLPWLQEHRAAYSGLFGMIDGNVYTHWGEAVEATMGQAPRYVMPAGGSYVPGGMEALKTLDTCQALWGAMLEAQLDRRGLALIFGGGALGDVGGFCAATYKRGIAFAHIPTTLLAMTDAALGGKVGLDFRGIKNAVGAFCQPVAVFADPTFLQTLPPREWHSGLAEVVKHAYIGAPKLLQYLQQQPNLMNTPQAIPPEEWQRLLRASIAVKARIVNEDPLERGLRALLNFGHTFGHGLESYFLRLEQPITHGEAIAVGMLCELEDPSPADLALLRPLLPPVPLAQVPWPEVWASMQQDKKNLNGQVIATIPGQTPYSLRKTTLTAVEAEHRWRRSLEQIGQA